MINSGKQAMTNELINSIGRVSYIRARSLREYGASRNFQGLSGEMSSAKDAH
jgi:hypothetical protein